MKLSKLIVNLRDIMIKNGDMEVNLLHKDSEYGENASFDIWKIEADVDEEATYIYSEQYFE